MHMGKLSLSLPALLFFYCVSYSLYCLSHAESISFAFPPRRDIIVDNSAYFQGAKLLQLTPNQITGNLGYSYGWAVYNRYVPLWDKSSRALANFSTHFQFIIGDGNDVKNGYGDGIAFFLAPFDLEQPLNVAGAALGLFNTTKDYGGEVLFGRTAYQMVAVEFDTYKNPWDPDDNHVGIDVNSIFSKANVSLSNKTAEFGRSVGEALKNGAYWDAWVDYDGGSMQLQVFLLYNPNDTDASKPQKPILFYDIDLRDFLPENIKVGLSASTGSSTETHSVYGWNFSCEYSWKISSGAPGGHARSKKNYSVTVILILLLASVLAVCGFVFLGQRLFFRKEKEKPVRKECHDESDVKLDEWFAQGPRKYSYTELSAATRNFCDEEKLGQGGFGGVYRGIFPGTVEAVAVKKISRGSKQGKKEYVSEVTIISKLRHRNLVQLLGWCHEKNELLLVYEYLPNGSLDKYLLEEQKDITLDWDRRYSIACDIASALVYLHEEWDQRVVHRDIKSSNVMLDSKFNAKLGDFGLARLVEREQAASHTTVVAGTLGYLAPECVMTGKSSPESDVFSFGAVTLEITCGRRPVDRTLNEHNCRLVEWVWDLYAQGKLLDGADGKLDGNFNPEEMLRLMLLGLLCSHPDPKTRPTMREVTKILKLEAEMPYVPLDMPVAVYSQRRPLDLPSFSTSTSIILNSSAIGGVSMSTNSSAVNVSAFSSSTASSQPGKVSSPLLFHMEP